MRKKNSNAWQSKMYDPSLALMTIGSSRFNDLAKKEASFVLDQTELRAGQKILDVPCGTGRHSVIFAKNDIHVTALDINPDLLKIAERQARKIKNINFAVADMSNLKKYRGQFDVTANLFSSFGYFFSDAENKKVLRELYSTLKPGGTFVLHLIDRDWLMTVYEPTSWKQDGDTFILAARKFDPSTNYNEAHEVFLNEKTGFARRYYHRMRLYSKAEMVRLLKEVGFRKVEVFGDANGSEFVRTKSTHPFYFAVR